MQLLAESLRFNPLVASCCILGVLSSAQAVGTAPCTKQCSRGDVSPHLAGVPARAPGQNLFPDDFFFYYIFSWHVSIFSSVNSINTSENSREEAKSGI